MKNLERGKFEDAWHKAFENAEQAPSENVWAGLEGSLNKTETGAMKRRVVFYQRLAAASVLFALLLGGITTYYISNRAEQQMNLAQEKSSQFPESNAMDNITGSKSTEENISKIRSEEDDVIDSKEGSLKENTSQNATGFVANLFDKTDDTNIIRKDSVSDQQVKQSVIRHDPSLLSMIPEPRVAVKGRMKEVTIVRKLPAMPSAFMDSKKDKRAKENIWASMGASAGNYSAPSQSLSPVSSAKATYLAMADAQNTSSAFSTASTKGTVFSVGMNVGKRISKRWLVLGGVAYMSQSTGYTSNFAAVDANNNLTASVAEYANRVSFSSLVTASPYQINSVNELISVPLQAGYLLIDRRIGLQLNSGVATDFFVQNTINDESGQLASYSSGAGDSSPYRTVSWAGLMGTELSYRIATRYRVSLAPGLRYSFNSVLKPDASPSRPLAWDVGFRFRYIFR